MSRRWLGALAGLVAGLGCGSLGCGSLGDPMGRGTALEESQLRYTQHVRWGNLDAASEFVDPELRGEFLRQAPAFEAIRITEYEIGRIEYGQDRASATVRVTYRAYSLASLEEKRVEEQQSWVRPGTGNTWWVRPRLANLLQAFPEAAR
jgi:hypothetical protein